MDRKTDGRLPTSASSFKLTLLNPKKENILTRVEVEVGPPPDRDAWFPDAKSPLGRQMNTDSHPSWSSANSSSWIKLQFIERGGGKRKGQGGEIGKKAGGRDRKEGRGGEIGKGERGKGGEERVERGRGRG